jgi:hypothetical protein
MFFIFYFPFSGKGKKIYKNKTIYEGDWLANKRHGYGVLTKKVDDIYIFVYEGKWINNRFVSIWSVINEIAYHCLNI